MDDLKLMRDAGESMSPRCKMGFDRADNGTVSRVNPHIITILRQIIHIRAKDSDSIGLSQNHPQFEPSLQKIRHRTLQLARLSFYVEPFGSEESWQKKSVTEEKPQNVVRKMARVQEISHVPTFHDFH